jgi:hypothetical protein
MHLQAMGFFYYDQLGVKLTGEAFDRKDEKTFQNISDMH